ncbi:type II toxin-antitoxin system MqsA family antitoxin [Propionispira raffinosivorans]|uniref:type II toxin-antitoxin system MqsA family antitoxin n=1 Tax=Propionispira raffinosivorans TaxID=86959 RepID=UPI00248047B7|nr:type II toxin-antitoxin system MqsA family antitoxin [Propionispira raffinosivorans]
MCKGHLENNGTTFMVDLGNCIVIIKNVPSQVCSQCDEVSYSNVVTKQIEKMVNMFRSSLTEIAIINYPITERNIIKDMCLVLKLRYVHMD